MPAKSTRAPDTEAPAQPDTETVERLAEQAAALLGAAPPADLTEAVPDAAAEAAQSYEAPTGRDVLDPEDNIALLAMAFKAIGRPVPQGLIQAARVAQQPIRDIDGQPDVLSPEQERERQERVQRKAEAAFQSVAGTSTKRDRYLNALRHSPTVTIYNRKDRWLMINRVRITVPEGEVAIPAMVAKEISTIDAREQWAAREERKAREFANIHPSGPSFVEKKVARFAIY